MKKKRPGKKPNASGKPPASRSASKRAKRSKTSHRLFCIAGLGASAGGLEAFEQFFAAMPADGNVGFVLVPHLDPGHSSMLPELLQRYSQMPVIQAKHGTKVLPNHIYIVPPNREMAILQSVLHLSELPDRQGLRLPIDGFFRSLAVDQGKRAVGILLSGNGSDGTLGLKAIKAEYGLVIVQEPNSAKYRGMPQSAIAAGIVDFVLPPAKMPEQLLKYAGHQLQGAIETSNRVERSHDRLGPIFLLLRSQTGHDFSFYKKNTICRRIERRLNVHQIGDLGEYTRYLQQNPQEVEMLFKELLIGVTGFFRDSEAFDLLRRRIAGEMLRGTSPDSTMRVWVPGCSTGEEVYTLAIVLREAMDETKANPKIQIFGTDIDNEAIDTARAGRYPAGAAAEVSPERLKRFFVKDGNFVRIKKEIREMALFAVQNVIKDPPFTKLDLICCRNLLIYLDSEIQRRLIPIFHYVLKPGGLLLLGSSETVGTFGDLFSLLDKKWKLFRRKDAVGMQIELLHDIEKLGTTGERKNDESRPGRQISVPEVAEKELLDKYAPPCVIVNHRGDILYAHGRTGKFLELASGSASLNVHEMAREGLRLELASAVRKCSQQKKYVSVENVQVKTNGGYQPIRLEVRPLRQPDHQLGTLTLVAFHEREKAKAPRGTTAASSGKTSSKRVAELEQELRFTQESLQTSIEEMETSNEELKSMNEELQSTNEELQSTNEELETSKEEMQSLNEELVTLNSELEGKIDELSQTNNDMKNLFDSTRVATVFLDTRLRVKRFTPDATRIVNLIQTDINRPLNHLVSNLANQDLVQEAQKVLETLVPREMVVKDKESRAFLMRVMPYRTLDNHVEGVVMTFTDIGAEHLLQAAREFAQGIVETVRQPLLVLDARMRVLQANPAFYEKFAVESESTEQSVFFDLGNGQWNIPQLRELLKRIFVENSKVVDFEVKHDFPDIGRRTMLVSARRIFHMGIGTDTLLLAIEDVSAGRSPRSR